MQLIIGKMFPLPGRFDSAAFGLFGLLRHMLELQQKEIKDIDPGLPDRVSLAVPGKEASFCQCNLPTVVLFHYILLHADCHHGAALTKE